MVKEKLLQCFELGMSFVQVFTLMSDYLLQGFGKFIADPMSLSLYEDIWCNMWNEPKS